MDANLEILYDLANSPLSIRSNYVLRTYSKTIFYICRQTKHFFRNNHSKLVYNLND